MMSEVKIPEAVCEVVDEKYNRVQFYRQTGDTSKPYHLPRAKLYDQACVDYLAAQRDEGLAREAELRLDVSTWKETASCFEDFYRKTEAEKDTLQQRLAESKRLLLDVRGQLCGPDQRAIDAFLARRCCADGEKSE